MACCCTQMATRSFIPWCVAATSHSTTATTQQQHNAGVMLDHLVCLCLHQQGSTIVLRDKQDSSAQEFLQVRV